jgi:hypothetical protein
MYKISGVNAGIRVSGFQSFRVSVFLGYVQSSRFQVQGSRFYLLRAKDKGQRAEGGG